jgi:hypothetical protein
MVNVVIGVARAIPVSLAVNILHHIIAHGPQGGAKKIQKSLKNKTMKISRMMIVIGRLKEWNALDQMGIMKYVNTNIGGLIQR